MKKSAIPGPAPSRKVDVNSVGKSNPGKFSVTPSSAVDGSVKKAGGLKQTPTGVYPEVTKVGSGRVGEPMAPKSFKRK